MVGVLAVELFETADGALLVNELAMRPHNSGHWTMDGAAHQPVRAAPARGARLPARRHRRRSRRSTVMANVLGARGRDAGDGHGRAAAPPVRRGCPTSRCTCTARSERPGRKIGHVNVLGDDARPRCDVASCVNAPRGRHTGCRTAQWTDGWDDMATMSAERDRARARRRHRSWAATRDWPVMEAAAQALDEFDVPYEVGVVSAHRTPRPDARLRARRRPAAGCG